MCGHHQGRKRLDPIEDEVDTEGLWQLVKKKHKVHSAREVKEVVKLYDETKRLSIHHSIQCSSTFPSKPMKIRET